MVRPRTVAGGVAPTSAVTADKSAAGAWKLIWSAQRFQPVHFNLGGHVPRIGNNKSCGVWHGSNVFHYHLRSAATRMKSAMQACISHGYIGANDSKEVMLQTLRTLRKNRPGCGFASCHKIYMLLDFLQNATKVFEHPLIFPNVTTVTINITAFRDRLDAIFSQYPSLHIQ